MTVRIGSTTWIKKLPIDEGISVANGFCWMAESLSGRENCCILRSDTRLLLAQGFALVPYSLFLFIIVSGFLIIKVVLRSCIRVYAGAGLCPLCRGGHLLSQKGESRQRPSKGRVSILTLWIPSQRPKALPLESE